MSTAANVVDVGRHKSSSQMSGFGEAADWGKRLAEAVRAYAQANSPRPNSTWGFAHEPARRQKIHVCQGAPAKALTAEGGVCRSARTATSNRRGGLWCREAMLCRRALASRDPRHEDYIDAVLGGLRAKGAEIIAAALIDADLVHVTGDPDRARRNRTEA